MLFRNNRNVRAEFDETFLIVCNKLKTEYTKQLELTVKGEQFSSVSGNHLALAKAKYFYTLKEAKRRKVRLL